MTPAQMIHKLTELVRNYPHAADLKVLAIDGASGVPSELGSFSIQTNGATLEEFGIVGVTRYIQLYIGT